jgi:hypothetical protein
VVNGIKKNEVLYMEEQKQTYYFNIESGEVLDKPAEPEGHFTLFATGEEIKDFREYLRENYKADWATFGNAHLPFNEPDREHAEYDNAMKGIYAMVYKLGDAEAKNHVKNMGILTEDEFNRY